MTRESESTGSAEEARRWRSALEKATAVVAFTGAGISTDSGIPDYRGTGGVYERYQPVYFQDFLASAEKRREYWMHKASVWPAMRDARPGPGHRFVKDLDDRGILAGVVTQNIDGLHEKSGVPGDKIVNLHGTNLQVECLGCGQRRPAAVVLDSLAAEVARGMEVSDAQVPVCGSCGELVKPATVMFGQNLRSEDLKCAEELMGQCDLVLAMGSTLEVQPAATFPVLAHRAGAALGIITRGPTPLDGIATLRWDGSITAFLQLLGDFGSTGGRTPR